MTKLPQTGDATFNKRHTLRNAPVAGFLGLPVVDVKDLLDINSLINSPTLGGKRTNAAVMVKTDEGYQILLATDNLESSHWVPIVTGTAIEPKGIITPILPVTPPIAPELLTSGLRDKCYTSIDRDTSGTPLKRLPQGGYVTDEVQLRKENKKK